MVTFGLLQKIRWVYILYAVAKIQCDHRARYTDFYSVYQVQAKLGGYLLTIVILVQLYPIYMKRTLF